MTTSAVIVTYILVSISVPDRFGENFEIVQSGIQTEKACEDEAKRLAATARGLLQFHCFPRTQLARKAVGAK